MVSLLHCSPYLKFLDTNAQMKVPLFFSFFLKFGRLFQFKRQYKPPQNLRHDMAREFLGVLENNEKQANTLQKPLAGRL